MDNQEEKIGFKSGEPNSVDELEKKLPGKPLRVFAKLFAIFGVIFSSVTIMYYLLPIFSFIIGFMIGAVITAFMVVSVVLTLGGVLTFEGYRSWIGNHMYDVPSFFFNVGENSVKLMPYFYVAAIPAIVLTSLGLLLGIIGQAKYKRCVGYIVTNAVFLTLAVFFTFLFIATGIPF